MQAIVTKYIPATNTRGSRIKATCERGSITIPMPLELSGDAAHIAAADALVLKFAKEDAKQYGTPEEKNPWLHARICGGLPNGDMCHVFIDRFPKPGIERVSLLVDNEDAEHLRKGIELCKETEGTPGGFRMGLLASALKAATVEI